jgi:hypothetical protein
MLSRRSFLTGLIAAPVIVKFDSLMPVKTMPSAEMLETLVLSPWQQKELIQMIRNTLIPELIVQLYNSSPLLSQFLEV